MTEVELGGLKQLLVTPQPPALGPARRAGTLAEPELATALDPMLARAKVSAPTGELIRALLLLWHDHLEASHSISQGIENTDGSFIHAIMHRREPDAGNSKYWWRRVGQHAAFPEIARRVDELLRSHGLGDLAKRLLPGGRWSPDAFVDACDAAMSLPGSDAHVKLLQEIQRIESEVLLERLLRDAK